MREQNEGFVMHRIGCRLRIERIASILVEAFCGVVIDDDLRIVDEGPTTPPGPKANGHIVPDLSSGAAEPRVESEILDCGSTEAHVDTLEMVNIPGGTNTQVMIFDDPSKPLDLAHRSASTVLYNRSMMDNVPTTHATDAYVIGQVTNDPATPIAA